MDAQIVGERISKYRKTNKMTQQQLAEKLSVTNKAISKWETGGGLPDISLLPALSSVLGVSVDELISDELSENRPEGTFRRYLRKPVGWITVALVIAVLSGSVFVALRLLNTDDSHVLLSDNDSLDSGFAMSAKDAEIYYSDFASTEIRAALLSQEIVHDASVAVSIRVNSPFALPQDNTQDNSSTVAVTLILAENALLTATEVQLIAATIRNAVPHLYLVGDKISIMDSNQNTYRVSD